ncbi:serine/threonine protein kinase [Catenulispora sp. GAS73]|uniref:WD40 repeat domain-containing serine/threonine protein kinase n=1 Tax=Catenulispora sp. GAS73 TaxID=3156269 RepID=UPI0035147FDF
MSEAARGSIGGGRYLLVRVVASGGMGKVWEGLDTRLGRTVAIKEVSLDRIPPIEHTEFLARAVKEGHNAAALADHPNIVTVYDVVNEGGSPWTVMQFVKGGSLAGLLKSGPMAVDAVAAMAGQMLSALGLAHRVGIVHRDVKPHNIMIEDGDGRALLTDFGIAKNTRDAALTQTGIVIGSAAYMAPERYDGDSDNPASDLFSLGVTLFEAAEGYSPFAKGSATGTVTAILAKPLPDTEHAGRLRPLILALTEKDPDSRPTVEQAQAMLTEALVVRGQHSGASTGPRAAFQPKPEPMPELKPEPEPEPKPDPESVRESKPVQKQPTWRNAGTIILTGHTKAVRSLAFSPDGRTLASGGNDGTIRVWNVATGTLRGALAAHTGGVVELAFSPDGATIASSGKDKAVRLWNAGTGAMTATLVTDAARPQSIRYLTFSPDGMTLAGTGLATGSGLFGHAWLWHGTGADPTTLTSRGSDVGAAAFSPDGRRLATGGRSVKIWDLHSGAVVNSFRRKGVQLFNSVTFSADGRNVTGVSVGLGATKVTWDVVSGQATSHTVGDAADRNGIQNLQAFVSLTMGPAAFSRNARTFAVFGGQQIRVCRMADASILGTLKIHGSLNSGVRSVAISPDSRIVAAGGSDNLIRLWSDAFAVW